MKRILYISHCVPFPPDKGERIRAYQQIKALAGKYEVTLVCLNKQKGHPDLAALHALCREVHAFPAGQCKGLVRGTWASLTGGSVTEGYFRNPLLIRKLQALSEQGHFDLVFGYSSSVLPYVLSVPARFRVMDLVDMDSMKWQRYAEGANALMGLLYRRESQRVAGLETRAIRTCHVTMCVSQAEAMVAPVKNAKLQVIENGVDCEYFRPCEDGPGFSKSIVFCGSMDYRPNVEAVCWFARNVWPGLKAEFSNLQFVIVGRNPVRLVRRLANRDGITVTGEVRDVRSYLSSACVAVAPLLTARGVQNKVLEAMAMAKPVIASGPALEGLDVEIGSDVLQADSPEQWHGAVSLLLRDTQIARTLGTNARLTVQQKYSWHHSMEQVVEVCQRLLSGERLVLVPRTGSKVATEANS